jgi:hypothetical protein
MPEMTTPIEQPAPGCARLCLSEELALIVERSTKEVVRVEDVISFFHDRAYTFLLLLLSLPLVQPFPVPGLSSPFGLLIAPPYST